MKPQTGLPDLSCRARESHYSSTERRKIDIALLSDSLSYRTAGFTVEKDSGIIRYMKQQQARTDYHTIVIPIGGEYQVKLSDGTMVWLNSDSRLKIPTAFVGNERRVFIGRSLFRCSEK
ncbi:MAG: hypothetical protein ACLU30_14635 [Odoribacter splanchnicus]